MALTLLKLKENNVSGKRPSIRSAAPQSVGVTSVTPKYRSLKRLACISPASFLTSSLDRVTSAMGAAVGLPQNPVLLCSFIRH